MSMERLKLIQRIHPRRHFVGFLPEHCCLRDLQLPGVLGIHHFSRHCESVAAR